MGDPLSTRHVGGGELSRDLRYHNSLHVLNPLQVLSKWSASGASYGFVIIPLVTVIVAAILSYVAHHDQLPHWGGAGAWRRFVGELVPAGKKAAVTEACKDCSGQVISCRI